MNLPNNLPMPDGMTKRDIVSLLLKEEYGYLPDAPHQVSADVVSIDNSFCAGKADLLTLNLICGLDQGNFSFPVYYARKKAEGPVPCFIHINFRDSVPDRYQPTEELIDAGYSVMTFCYKDVTSDDGDFKNGLAGIVYPDGKRKPDQCGKIGLWAWAVMRVMDYAVTLKELDGCKISVVGHSRLGKTALLAGALDERFYCAFSNDSGCSGAALARGNTGETVGKILDNFSFWFCENYKKYAGNENKLAFDQHFLIAANYPHRVYVASAEDDWWACPSNEYLACTAASGFFEKSGSCGFFHPQRLPAAGEFFHNGNIGYHMREGSHYLSRTDWQFYIKFLNAKFKEGI